MFVGVDVAKAELVVSHPPERRSGATVANDEPGDPHAPSSGCARWPRSSSSSKPPAGTSCSASRRWSLPPCQSSSSIPRQVRDFARGDGPAREDGSHRCRHPRARSPTGPARRSAPRPMPRPRSSMRCWPGGGSSSRCSQAERNRLARSSARASARSGRVSRPTSRYLERELQMHRHRSRRDARPEVARLAGARRPAAECPGRRPRRCPYAPRGSAGARPAVAARDREARRRRPAESRLRHPTRAALRPGWARQRARACSTWARSSRRSATS